MTSLHHRSNENQDKIGSGGGGGRNYIWRFLFPPTRLLVVAIFAVSTVSTVNQIARSNEVSASSYLRALQMTDNVISTSDIDVDSINNGSHDDLATTTAQQGGNSDNNDDSNNNINDNDIMIGHVDPQVRIKHFKDTALQSKPVTDKIGHGSPRDKHRYHNMYERFLLPYGAFKPHMKFLEIGLGCNMEYEAGASVNIWKKLFPDADLWEGEYDGNCVEEAKKKGQLDGINVLVGDQGDVDTFNYWIESSGGQFDVIIDDGGHHNCQILNTFQKMWPQLLPGGYYFVEDLHVGTLRTGVKSDQCDYTVPFHEYLVDWQTQLIYQTVPHDALKTIKHRGLPDDLAFVHCQAEACVLHKRKDGVNLPHNEELMELKKSSTTTTN